MITIQNAEFLGVTDARKNFLKLVKEVHDKLKKVILTRGGKAEAVMMSMEEYEGLIETIRITTNPKMMEAIREGLADLEAGKGIPYEKVRKKYLKNV